MNDNIFTGLITELKQAREEQEALALQKKELETALQNNPEYIRICETLKEITSKVNDTEKTLKSGLTDDLSYTPPFKAAWLINTTKVNIDEKLALVWAKVNMAAAVSETVDKKMLTDFAKNNPDAATYATVVEGKDVRIATDLSKFID